MGMLYRALIRWLAEHSTKGKHSRHPLKGSVPIK